MTERACRQSPPDGRLPAREVAATESGKTGTMARKPNPSLRTTPCDARAPERPWLKSYPKGVAWDARFRPALVGSLLDQAVQAYGTRPCTYFMCKRVSFAAIGELSDRAAKGLRAIGVGEGVKVGLLLPNSPTFVIFYYGVLKAGGTIVNADRP